MSNEAPERIWVGFNDDEDFPLGYGAPVLGKEMFWETPEMSAPNDREGLTEFVREDLARATPTVKPLEWHTLPDTTYKAEDYSGVYCVYPNQQGDWTLDDGESVSPHPTADAAKAAGNKEKKRRILSALK